MNAINSGMQINFDIPFWILSRITPYLPEKWQDEIHRVVGGLVILSYRGEIDG